jgi:hypothetical protein
MKPVVDELMSKSLPTPPMSVAALRSIRIA